MNLLSISPRFELGARSCIPAMTSDSYDVNVPLTLALKLEDAKRHWRTHGTYCHNWARSSTMTIRNLMKPLLRWYDGGLLCITVRASTRSVALQDVMSVILSVRRHLTLSYYDKLYTPR